jgi:hypothetical protein
MKFLSKKSVLVSVLALSLGACATGSTIVTGTKRTPLDPGQVKLYAEAPAHYEVIGIVSAESAAGLTAQGSEDYALQELKHRAAQLGANGVLLQSTTQQIAGAGRGVSGKAVFVSD